VVIAPDDAGFAAARACYVARLPGAEPRFAFADFRLFRLLPVTARYVAGFGRAYSVSPEELQRAASEQAPRRP
jgi:hypothetical protein